MISLCPACKTEQMVTAIALQENRGVVHCEACAEPFKPRAHRVTPTRERAFKQRLKDLQLAMAASPEEIVLSPVNYNPAEDSSEQRGTCELNPAKPSTAKLNVAGCGDVISDDLGDNLSGHIGNDPGAGVDKRGDCDPDTTRRLVEQGKNLQNEEAGIPAAQSNSKTMGGSRNAAQRAGRAGPSMQQSLPPNMSDIMRTSIKEQPAPASDSGVPNQSQLLREGVQMKQPSHTLSPEAIRRQRMRKERHAIARQKLLLEYEKLKVENEKLAVEKKKIELEKVKLEIMSRHQLLEAKRVDPFVSKGKALDGRPVVEYDIKADLLPRTPHAIDHGAKPAANKNQKVHLELLPNEPSRLFRKNLVSRSKRFKAK